jgi:hypothetical protein
VEAHFLDDLWKAAQVASPFVSMAAVLFMILARRDKAKAEAKYDALEKEFRLFTNTMLERVINGLNAGAVGMSGVSSGISAIQVTLNAIKELAISQARRWDIIDAARNPS